jgi:hypothetical protein
MKVCGSSAEIAKADCLLSAIFRDMPRRCGPNCSASSSLLPRASICVASVLLDVLLDVPAPGRPAAPCPSAHRSLSHRSLGWSGLPRAPGPEVITQPQPQPSPPFSALPSPPSQPYPWPLPAARCSWRSGHCSSCSVQQRRCRCAAPRNAAHLLAIGNQMRLRRVVS